MPRSKKPLPESQPLNLVKPKVKRPAVAKNAISLFSGAGGDSIGLKQAGYNVVAFSEFKKPAIATHLKEFPSSRLLVCPETASNDITKIPDETFEYYKHTIDIVFAGFPCQGYSNAGKKKADDPRNELVNEFARVINITKPNYIIGENVSGLLSRKGKDPKTGKLRPVIDIIRDVFSNIGYNITYKVLKATDFGVPQERKRLIIVGSKADLGHPHMPWDSLVSPTLPKNNSIRSFLETHLEGAVEFNEDNIPEGLSPHYTNAETQTKRYWITTNATKATGKAHPNLIRLVNGIRNKSSKEKEDGDDTPLTIEGGLISFGVRKSAYHGQILDPDMPSKTIICTYGTCPRLFVGLHNPDEGKFWVRCLSVKELGQIQGFPAEYQWQGNEKEIITQIGNAVPPALCESVVRTLPNITFKTQPQTNTSTEKDDKDEEDNEN
jgi:DNA (cytosine-5)-methyltransferase 1